MTTSAEGADVAWSGEDFRGIVEATPTALVVVDRRGDIALVNTRGEAMFGYARGELLGRPVETLVPERYRGEHPAARSAFFGRPQARAMGAGRDLYALRKDGSEVPVEIGLTPLNTARGAFVLAAIIDISERRRAEERFRLAVESSPNAMLITDARGAVVLMNSEAERLFGWTREEMLGRSVDLLVPARYRERHPASRDAFFASPGTRPMGAGRDLYALRKDGVEVPVEIGLNPIDTPEGVLVLSSVIDISERKRAEESLARYARELERSNSDLQEFAAVASHDLQEPLRKIAAFGELLQSRAGAALDEESRDYVARMQTAARRMSGLITSLLELSRVTTRGQPLRPVSLVDSVAEAVADLELRIAETSARLEIGPLPTVMGDPAQIRQLFLNLLGNALKFRAPDRVPTVVLRAERGDDGSWCVEVEDNGIGFDEKYLDRLFKPFSRLHAASAFEGSGMGLAICRKIAARHGGEVTARARPGRGSVFRVTFPPRRDEGG